MKKHKEKAPKLVFSHVDMNNIINHELYKLMISRINAAHEWKITGSEALLSMFNEYAITCISASVPAVSHALASYSGGISYPVKGALNTSITFTAEAWRRAGMIAPAHSELVEPHPELLEFIGAVWPIRQDFAVAASVVAWLNTNCTAAAMRDIFPAILDIAPNFPKRELGGSYKTPKDMGRWVQYIRRAASTLAEARLCRPEASTGEQGFAITFDNTILPGSSPSIHIPNLSLVC